MATIWLYSILSVLVVSTVSLIGVLTIFINAARLQKTLLFLVSFAAGALLGDAFIHLVPQAYAVAQIAKYVPFLILAGMMFFFILEKILHWRHCHLPTSANHPHPVAVNNIVGDSFHNFIDGMIIAASYMVSPTLGIATTVAVLLHEIPQEIGDFGILLYAGWSRRKALFYNYLSSLIAVIGAILTIVIGSSLVHAADYLVPFTIGGFIYIAAADLIPELKKEAGLGRSGIQLLSLLAGIGLMALLLVIG